MAKNDLVLRLLLSMKDFDANISKSSAEIKRFRKQVEDTQNKISTGFNASIKTLGAVGAVFGVATGAADVFKAAIGGTQKTMDAFQKTIDEVKGGVDYFFQSLARDDWDNFHEGFRESIRLAGELSVSLDNLNTQKIRFKGEESQYQLRGQEIRTALAKARFEKNAPEIKKQEEALEKLDKDWQAAINKHLNDFTDFTVKELNAQLNRTDVTPQQLLKLTSQEYRPTFEKNVKEYDDLFRASKERGTMSTPYGSMDTGLTPAAQKAAKELKKMEGTEQHISWLIQEQKDDMLQTVDAIIAENQLRTKSLSLTETEYNIKRKNKKLLGTIDKANDPLKTALGNIDAKYNSAGILGNSDLLTAGIKKKIETLETKLKVEIDPDSRLKLISELEKEKKRLQFYENAAKPIQLKADIAKSIPKAIEIPDVINPINKYAQASDMLKTYNAALEETSFLYGENSEKVAVLTTEINKLIASYNEANGTSLAMLGNDKTKKDIEGMSQATGQLANTLMGINDNPGLKALGLSLMVLSSMKGIAEAFEVNVWYGIAAAAATAASVVSTVSTMNSAKFAGGGIVGDHNMIRVNEGEMILNTAQQSRLFSLFNGENAKNNGGGQVQFHVRGTDLVGVLKNHKSKFN